MPQNPNALQPAPVSGLSLYIRSGHNAITVDRETASRQTTGRTIDAMIDAMDPDDVFALQTFCTNVIKYTANRPITCQNVSQLGLRRI